MKTKKLLGTLIVTLFAATHCAYSEVGNQSDISTNTASQTSVSVTGRISLPKQLPSGLDPSVVNLSRLTGHVEFAMPSGAKEAMRKIMGPPADSRELSPEEEKARIREFLRNATAKQLEALASFRLEAKKTKPIPVKFGLNGEFEVSGLTPGTWKLHANIPHPKEQDLSYAAIERVFDVTAGTKQIALGELKLDASPALMPSEPAPDFTGKTSDGKEFKLSEQRGKLVILDFWATWCAPCLAETKNLVAVHREFGAENVCIIGLSVDESFEVMKKFVAKNPVPYSEVYVGERSQSEAAKAFGVQMIPSIWLIGPDGKIIARNLRGDEIREAVRRFIKNKSQADAPGNGAL